MSTVPTFNTAQAERLLAPRPLSLPPRADLVQTMLSKTRRLGTPIRNAFVQGPRVLPQASRASMLAKFRSSSHLDAFLFIHSLASAKEPYEVVYPAGSWARALGLDENSGSSDDDLTTAKTQWSKNVSKLVSLNLIQRERSGSRARWVLLNESGDGTGYVRPKSERDGHWFMLPHAYWLDGHYLTLSFAAKAMLLIALSSKPGFSLPLERVKQWYGLSRSTAQRGFSELEETGLLTFSQTWRVEPNSPRQWAEVREYSLLGDFSAEAIKESMRTRRKSLPKQIEAAPTQVVASIEDLIANTRGRKSSRKEGGDIE